MVLISICMDTGFGLVIPFGLFFSIAKLICQNTQWKCVFNEPIAWWKCIYVVTRGAS